MTKKIPTLLLIILFLSTVACVDGKIVDKLATGQALTSDQAETYRKNKEQYDRIATKRKEELAVERLIYKLAQREKFLPKDEYQLYLTDPEGFSQKAKEKRDELIKEGKYQPAKPRQTSRDQKTQSQNSTEVAETENVSSEGKTKFPPIPKIPPIE